MAVKKPFRRSIGWIIAGIWIGSALLIFVTTRIHPSARANISVSVQEISFRTDAKYIFDSFDEDQLIVSGLSALHVDFNGAPIEGATEPADRQASFALEGNPTATCSFFQVRSSRIELAEPSIVTLGVPPAGGAGTFNLKLHGSVSASLTSLPGNAKVNPGFACVGTRSGGKTGDVEKGLSPQGLDSLFITTATDSRFDFVLAGSSKVGNTQIPVLGEIRFSNVDPRTSEEKTILLPESDGHKNEIVFEGSGTSIALDDADLLIVVPEKDFTLRRFSINDGIHLNFYGAVRDVRVGAAATDMVSRMPSYLDHLDSQKRILSMVPALVGLFLGLLEKMGSLPRK